MNKSVKKFVIAISCIVITSSCNLDVAEFNDEIDTKLPFRKKTAQNPNNSKRGLLIRISTTPEEIKKQFENNKKSALYHSLSELKDAQAMNLTSILKNIELHNKPLFYSLIKSGIRSNEDIKNRIELDLSKQNLKSLYGLGAFQNLERLNLSNNSISEILELKLLDKLKDLNLSNNQIVDISVIENLIGVHQCISPENFNWSKEINRLNYENYSKKGRLTHLVEGLQKLNLRNNPLYRNPDCRISPFFKIIGNHLEYNFSGFSTLLSLKKINPHLFKNIMANNVIKLETNEGIRKITHLELKNYSSKKQLNLKGIEQFENLESLEIKNTETTVEDVALNLSSLKRLNKLRVVKIDGLEIQNLAYVCFIPNLEELTINNAKIDDLDPLVPLHSVKKLDLSNNQISKLENIQCIKSLRELYLDYNYLENIFCLQNTKMLTKLSISNNQISTFLSIVSIRSLNELNLSGNKISYIPSLFEMTGLRDLDLSYNQIKDFGSLTMASQIKRLKVLGNKNTHFDDFAELIKRGVTLDYNAKKLKRNQSTNCPTPFRGVKMESLTIKRKNNISSLMSTKYLDFKSDAESLQKEKNTDYSVSIKQLFSR